MSADPPKKPMGGGAPLKRAPAKPVPAANPPGKPAKPAKTAQPAVPTARSAAPAKPAPRPPAQAARSAPPARRAEPPPATAKPAKALAVEIDGVPLPDEDAVAVWRRFSEWMEEKNDLKGFAAEEGVASVKPTVKNGRPTLLVTN